jgi:phage portal protein BeeE
MTTIRQYLPDVFTLAGAVVIIVGIAQWSRPAAIVLAGAWLVAHRRRDGEAAPEGRHPMSILAQFLERRASPENPSTNLSNPASWLWDALGARPSATGVTVNERTSLQSTAVYACVRIIAETVASLPLQVFRRQARGKDVARDHPLYRILHERPNPEMSSFTFRETMQGHVCTWGNAYAEIEMAKSGRVLALWPLRPDHDAPRAARERTDHLPHKDQRRRAGSHPGGEYAAHPRARLRRLVRLLAGRALPPGDRAVARDRGIRREVFRQRSAPGRRAVASAEARQGSERSGSKRAGSRPTAASRTRSAIAVLEEGVTYTAIGTPPDDAQFLETRKFQVTDVARIYRVPPHMVGDLERATFSNIEQQSIEFTVHTIRPWLVRWEQEMNYDLFSERDQGEAFAEFNVDGLLRGDSQQRAAFYQSMFNLGALSPNDIRERENMNPVANGDIYLVPLNMTTLEHAGEQPGPTPAPAPQPTSQDPQPAADPAQRAALPTHNAGIERLLADVAERMLRRELTQARRAVRRGRESFPGWIDEFYAEHREAVERALEPVIGAAALFAGAEPEIASTFARQNAAAIAASWAAVSADELRRSAGVADWEGDLTRILDQWERNGALSLARTATGVLTISLTNRTLTQGRAA